MDNFEQEIKTEFINEALLNLEEAEESFMALESTSDPKPLLEKIFRLAHNLKGGSRAVGFGDVAEFTHHLEDLVSKIQKGQVDLGPDVITVLLKANDRLVEMFTTFKENLEAKFESHELVAEIEAWANGSMKNSAPAAVSEKAEPVIEEAAPVLEIAQGLDDKMEMPLPPAADNFFAAAVPAEVAVVAPIIEEVMAPAAAAEVVAAVSAVASAAPAPTKTKENAAPSDKDSEVIRVSLQKIDLLNDYVGELIVLQSVIQQQAFQPSKDKLHSAVQQMVKLSKEIQNLSMGLRMLPVKPLVQKLQRVVRDTARVLTKDVQFQVVGDGLEIDKSVMDQLGDPLVHVVRNAVDHGLESTEDREASGKSKQGNVTLSFANDGNHLVVEVRDDGKGIKPDVIRQKAIEKGVIKATDNLTEKQLIHLIFHPGFSTKATASEISGRGVGMDVVKTNVEKIGGHVDVHSEPGKGSIFKLQIPLSLAVIEGLVVTSESNRYVIPLGQVQETLNIESQKIHQNKLGVGACIELRGKVVPVFGIEEVLRGEYSAHKITGTALVINVDEHPVAILVKDVLRAQQIVIKPLSNGIPQQKGWIGSCVLGDGLPTLILSPVELLKGRLKLILKDKIMEKVA